MDHESTYAGVNVFKDLLDAAMLFDQVDGSLGADSLDGAAVVAAQQNAQVYELGGATERWRRYGNGDRNVPAIHFQISQF